MSAPRTAPHAVPTQPLAAVACPMLSAQYYAFQQHLRELEYTYFPPGSETANEFTIAISPWRGLCVVIALFPTTELEQFRAALSRSRLALAPSARAEDGPFALVEPDLAAKGHPLPEPDQLFTVCAASS